MHAKQFCMKMHLEQYRNIIIQTNITDWSKSKNISSSNNLGELKNLNALS